MFFFSRRLYGKSRQMFNKKKQKEQEVIGKILFTKFSK